MLLCESELMRESGGVVVLVVAFCRFFFPVSPLLGGWNDCEDIDGSFLLGFNSWGGPLRRSTGHTHRSF